MTANRWRWFMLLFAAGTLVGGIIGLCMGGSKWPAVIGSVGVCILGEAWRRQLRREWRKLDALEGVERYDSGELVFGGLPGSSGNDEGKG